jgi:iron(III) transport system substrate-binding protein
MTDIVFKDTTRMKPKVLMAFATAAILPLLATTAAAQSWDAVIDAAKQEAAVTIYAGTSHPIIDQEIEAFHAKYPQIKFDILDGEANDLNARIDQEVASGKPTVDLYISTDSEWIPDVNQRKIIAGLTGPSAQGWPADYRVGNSYKIALIAGGIVINTDLVKRPINGYEDLVGDEFKNGKLGMKQWSNITTAPFHTFLEHQYPGLLDKLAAQKPTIYRSSEAGASSVASGELAAVEYAVSAVPNALIAQGAPIKWILPKDPFGLAVFVNVIKDAPHANAAQLFADFLLSEEGQKIWNPAGSGQASPLGFGDVKASSINLLQPGKMSAAEVAEQKSLWEKRFGK